EIYVRFTNLEYEFDVVKDENDGYCTSAKRSPLTRSKDLKYRRMQMRQLINPMSSKTKENLEYEFDVVKDENDGYCTSAKRSPLTRSKGLKYRVFKNLWVFSGSASHLHKLPNLKLILSSMTSHSRLQVEAAFILVVGPTLKSSTILDLSPKEITYAKNYPAHTAVCIAKGWEFCSSKQGASELYEITIVVLLLPY
nr:hypothetical protein [Tanacetum cinerariifolium]